MKKDEIIREVVCKHFGALVTCLVDSVGKYDVMFATVTSVSYEPDRDAIMFSDDLFLRRLKMELTCSIVFYIRYLGEETIRDCI